MKRGLRPDGEYVWGSAGVVLSENPENANAIAFVRVQDIDAERRERAALDDVIDEEVENVGILDPSSGIYHIVRTTRVTEETAP